MSRNRHQIYKRKYTVDDEFYFHSFNSGQKDVVLNNCSDPKSIGVYVGLDLGTMFLPMKNMVIEKITSIDERKYRLHIKKQP